MRLDRVRSLQETVNNGDADISDDADSGVANRRDEDDDNDEMEVGVKENYANDERKVKRFKVNDNIKEKEVNFETLNKYSTSIDPPEKVECSPPNQIEPAHQVPLTVDPPSSGNSLPYFPPLSVTSDNPFSRTYTSEHTAKAMLTISRENYGREVASKAVSGALSENTLECGGDKHTVAKTQSTTNTTAGSNDGTYQRMQNHYHHHNDTNSNQDYIQMGNFTSPSVPYSCDQRPLPIPEVDSSANDRNVVDVSHVSSDTTLSPPPTPSLPLIAKSSLNNRADEELATLDLQITSLETELSLNEEDSPNIESSNGSCQYFYNLNILKYY